MQVAGNKAAAILGVGGRVGSTRARAEIISVIKIGVEVRREVSAKVRIEVSIKVKIATTKEIRFEVKVGFSGKS
jgi:hypothetical protein